MPIAATVTAPYEYFANPQAGRPVADGYIYIGVQDLDPEIPANQIAVIAVQEDGTEVALLQPIRTNAGGLPTYNGSVIQLKVEVAVYSIKVLDRDSVLVYYQDRDRGSNVSTNTPSFSDIQTAADSDLTGYSVIQTESFWPWVIPQQPKGGDTYSQDNRLGPPGTIYPDNSGFFDANGNGYSLTIFNDVIDPFTFGCRGDGSDDTDSIDKMWAFYISKTAHFHAVALPSEQTGSELGVSIDWKPGTYSYNGTGLILDTADYKSVKMTAVPNTVRIQIVSDVFFITADDVNNAFIFGINFTGGKGAFVSSYTGNNVRCQFYVGHCQFQGYTVCAIGYNSIDWPYINIEFCRFRCDTSSQAIGIALSGFHDGSGIRYCRFDRNAYDIKVGARPGGNLYIENNDHIFLSSISTNRIAHVWIVPNTLSSVSGENIIISRNKWGNESMAVDDWRILFADENTGVGTANYDRPHLAVWNTTSYISGVKIINNNVIGVGNQTAALIYSYVRNARWITFKDNHVMTGDHTYLVEWAGNLDGEEHSSTWDIEYDVGSNPHVRFMPVSNQPMGLVFDKFVQSGGDPKSLQAFPTVQDDVSFFELLPIQDPNTGGSMVNATRTLVSDSLGGSSAIEVDASTSTGRWASGTLTEPVAGLPSFIEVDIKRSTTNPVSKVLVQIVRAGTAFYLVRRYIVCATQWVRVRIPFTPQVNGGTPNTYQLQVQVLDFVEGVTDRFQVGRLCVYQSRQSANYGHLRTQGGSAWNKAHMIMGLYHFWVDATGDLRIKSGAPTSDLDGTVVGTQT